MSQMLRNKLLDILEKEYGSEGNEYIEGIILLAPTDELAQNIIDVIEEWHPEQDQLTMFALDHYQQAFPNEY